MIQLLLLGIVVGFALLSLRGFMHAPRQALTQGIRRGLLWFGLFFLSYLAATGRLAIIVPLIGALVVALLRLLPVLVQFLPVLHRLWRQQAAQRPADTSSGTRRPTSTAESKYLRMHLNHATGEISGSVLAGRFSGRDLKSMKLDELVQLHRDCVRDDHDSAALLEAYLDRIHGDGWRKAEAYRETRSTRSGAMTREEAYEVLGLAPGASREAIIEAHRRLMQKVHPDRGGSDYLAAKINRAKDVLLA